MKKTVASSWYWQVLIVLSLAAMACSGVANLPNPFATATPTATSTPTSTPTPSPTPTATPTPTPLPTGVKVEKQADGTSLVVDFDNNFQLTIDKEWTVLGLTGEDLTQTIQDYAKANPGYGDVEGYLKDLDPKTYRALAFNNDRKYIFNGFTTNLIVGAVTDRLSASMPMDLLLASMEDLFKQQRGKILSSAVREGGAGGNLEIGMLEYSQTISNSAGRSAQGYGKMVIFRTDAGIAMIILTTLQQFRAELAPAVDEIAGSIILLNR